MAVEVYMDIPAVRSLSKHFYHCSDTLERAARTLDTLAETLRTSGFVGKAGRRVAVQQLERIGLRIKHIADQCNEMAVDIAASVDAYERGDEQGASRFY